jgi:MFS family permease
LSDRSSHPAPVGAAFVPVLVGITLVVSIISSLGAPLLPDVAKNLDISLPSAQWSLTAALIAGALSAPVLGRLGDGRHRRRAMLGALAARLRRRHRRGRRGQPAGAGRRSLHAGDRARAGADRDGRRA